MFKVLFFAETLAPASTLTPLQKAIADRITLELENRLTPELANQIVRTTNAVGIKLGIPSIVHEPNLGNVVGSVAKLFSNDATTVKQIQSAIIIRNAQYVTLNAAADAGKRAGETLENVGKKAGEILPIRHAVDQMNVF